MCDYSLYEFPNRLAREQEELVIHRFPSGAVGLANRIEVRDASRPKSTFRTGFWKGVKELFALPRPASSVCAVCVPPGARLLVKDISPRLQRQLDLSAEETATFIESSIEAGRYRDAVLFDNGRQVQLQSLCEGQRVDVLSLDPASEGDERVQDYRLSTVNF